MKKFTFIAAMTLSLALGISAEAFAKMTVESLRPITEPSFTGTILRVGYTEGSLKEGRPQLTADILNDRDKNNPTQLIFDGKDIPFGSTLSNSIGKNIFVLFSPETKLIEQIILES